MRPIDNLRSKVDFWKKATTDARLKSTLYEVLKLIDEAIYHMDHQEDESPWRRVQDELPESGVLVMIYDGGIGFGWHKKGAWEWVDTFESGPANVTHWMPLPEPPTEKTMKGE